MKKLLISILFLLMMTATAFAEWTITISNTADKNAEGEYTAIATWTGAEGSFSFAWRVSADAKSQEAFKAKIIQMRDEWLVNKRAEIAAKEASLKVEKDEITGQLTTALNVK